MVFYIGGIEGASGPGYGGSDGDAGAESRVPLLCSGRTDRCAGGLFFRKTGEPGPGKTAGGAGKTDHRALVYPDGRDGGGGRIHRQESAVRKTGLRGIRGPDDDRISAGLLRPERQTASDSEWFRHSTLYVLEGNLGTDGHGQDGVLLGR